MKASDAWLMSFESSGGKISASSSGVSVKQIGESKDADNRVLSTWFPFASKFCRENDVISRVKNKFTIRARF